MTTAQAALLNPQAVAQGDLEPGRSPLLGIGLASFAALLLELSLTRLFSVVLFYHFAFLAISVALLGLGAGGVFAYLAKSWLERRGTRALGTWICGLGALATVAALEVVLHLSVSLDLTWHNLGVLTAIYLASALPFFLIGTLFSLVFARETWRIALLYGADLGGGAAACLALVPLLNWLGGPNSILVAAMAMMLASAAWANGGRARRCSGAGAILLVLAISLNYHGRLADILYAKGMSRDPRWVEFARWNALSRVEVDQQGNAKAIVIDADASTYIMNVDPYRWQGTVWEKDLMSAPPALANVLRPHGAYAIIGPGGGVDVLRAVANGSPSVTGIEINPIIANTIMRGGYADYAYHLYEIPQVHIQVSDGRSFIRRTAQRFDVVQMTLVDTWASTAAGAFALSENNLYTVEAFREYFDHLQPDGLLAITRWEFRKPREALRVVAVAMEALHRMGVANPARNFMVVSERQLDEDGRPVLVLAKKSPFTRQEEEAVQAYLEAHPSLMPQYFPSSPASNAFSELIASNDAAGFARHYEYNVAPVDDNAPFFFFTLKPGQVLKTRGLRHGIDWKVNLGVVVLGMVLGISAGAVLAFLVLPLALQRRRGARRGVRLLYFIAIGLGYILVEIAFVQRFVLFLGHPTYALTVVVFLLLLSSGTGSLLSRRWLQGTLDVRLPLALIAAALLLYVFLLPPILASLVGAAFPLKLLLSGALLVPLGMAMGMPFPTGLRALSEPAPATGGGESPVEWAWALNAASSVLGSVLAMVIALRLGLNLTLAAGAAAYAAALLLTTTLRLPRARGEA